MDTPKQSEYTLVEKVGNPYKYNSFSRFAYYTDIEFNLFGKNIFLPMKVDTGSTYTVIGLKNKAVMKYKEQILQSSINKGAYDASGDRLALKGIVVENFKLTDDIIIPKIKIYFSEDIDDKALLGMNIMSLFEHFYKFDKNSTNGTYRIYNYKQQLSKLEDRMLNKELDYLDPELIDSIDEEILPVKKKYRMKDAEAAYANKISKQYMEENSRNNNTDASP